MIPYGVRGRSGTGYYKVGSKTTNSNSTPAPEGPVFIWNVDPSGVASKDFRAIEIRLSRL